MLLGCTDVLLVCTVQSRRCSRIGQLFSFAREGAENRASQNVTLGMTLNGDTPSIIKPASVYLFQTQIYVWIAEKNWHPFFTEVNTGLEWDVDWLDTVLWTVKSILI